MRRLVEEAEEAKAGRLSSKYWKMLLIVIAGILTFGAPYVAFSASHYMKRGVFFSFTGGFLSLALGLILTWYLVKKKVIA